MQHFCEITPSQITTNLFEDIGTRWLMIGCKDCHNDRINLMTASWGTMGVLWGKPVCVLFVRPQRYTHELMEESDRFSVSIFGEEYRDQLKMCGVKSGRDTDKVNICGFHPLPFGDICGFEEAQMVLCLKKLYCDRLKKDGFSDASIMKQCYPKEDLHTVYVCEIEKVFVVNGMNS